jgi:hypothetical protein
MDIPDRQRSFRHSHSTPSFDTHPYAQRNHKYPWALNMRQKLKDDGLLTVKTDHLLLTKDAEFSSPSAAAAVIHGGHANGLTAWKNKDGKTLKELESVQGFALGMRRGVNMRPGRRSDAGKAGKRKALGSERVATAVNRAEA